MTLEFATIEDELLDFLDQVDHGMPVLSIQIGGLGLQRGGLGPEYEQRLQLLGFEMLDVLFRASPDRETIKGIKDVESVLATALEEEEYGITGLMWSYAAELAINFYLFGPSAAVNLPGANKKIWVSNMPGKLPVEYREESE